MKEICKIKKRSNRKNNWNFSEKIDELNQETDSLLDEADKINGKRKYQI